MARALHWQEQTETDEVYDLGGLLFNWTDDDGCVWTCDKPEGWDAPTLSTPIDRKAGGHGGYVGQTTFLERTLSFDGMVVCPDRATRLAAHDRLLDAIAGELVGMTLYTDRAEGRSLWVRGTGDPNIRIIGGRTIEFAFVMVAEDPIKFGPTERYGPARLPTGRNDPGRRYPKRYPYRYDQGVISSPSTLTIPNVGTMPGHAVYTITGPVPRPIAQLQSGQFVGLDLDLGPLDTMVADTAAGTITVNGVNRSDALTEGASLPLIPSRTKTNPQGGTVVSFRSGTGGINAAAALYVDTAPSWK